MGKMKSQISMDEYQIKIDEYASSLDWANIGTVTLKTSAGSNGSFSSGHTYTVGAATGTTPYVMNQSGRIQITGDDADIDMNGKSLKTWMEAVESRLAILEPNTKLEAEWTELKELGDRYRTLEKEIQDKMKTWDILKKPE